MVGATTKKDFPIIPKVDEIEAAKKLIADTEQNELNAIGKEVAEFMDSLKVKGFALIILGKFEGGKIETGLQVIKIK